MTCEHKTLQPFCYACLRKIERARYREWYRRKRAKLVNVCSVCRRPGHNKSTCWFMESVR